ncbi:hypothetical protein QYE76_013807 [Lolium multiflorum]|uniref:Reverse transcriptase domain-containing protein n=1 Tax=Lolium multiflorum TaxID=4521 RepID=A0AAD8U3T2_LOLMU|nr:hypothetical protein QYE76_013807 [Lolium multiflorum]
MLVGCRDSMFEVGAISKGQFFISVQLLHRPSKHIFEAIGIYGPADHGRSRLFLEELSAKITASTRPLLIGGDFNLIRSAADKNNSNLNWALIDRFNEYIASWALQEIPRTGARFTWSNKQINPVRSTLDRVFISQSFESLFPLCSLAAETSLGSDHTPLVFDSRDEAPPRSSRFFFETGWFARADFLPLLQSTWDGFQATAGGRDILDWWIHMSGGLRQYLKGWSRNLGRQGRLEKTSLLAQIEALDRQADSSGIDDEAWALRYHLEEGLLQLYRQEKEYWRQRGRIKWALQGDANTAYFHAVANGRKRKCVITALITPAGIVSDPRGLQEHIYGFYCDLLGTAATRVCGLSPSAWGADGKVSTEENEGLALTFSEQELEEIVKDMKSDTAPGPDGFSVLFFKRCWPLVKHGVLHILNDFALGRIDISRLNFGIISLIPKVPGADQISQFRPITLINVIFKIVSKAFAVRLDPIAHRIINPCQTAFIKGRNILDGSLALIEIVHELRKKKLGGILLKLDFEKAYDRVNWEFLTEVLRCKGFDSGVIHRFSQLVSGGQTAIAINGEIGPFFRNRRGVRQGDPLSPLLFNFIGEALSGILVAAVGAGHIQGVVPHLVPGGITHLQYADDTLVLIQNTGVCIRNLKFLLMCFEDMPGLKINYHKSEVIVMGQPEEEQDRIANLLNCKRGSFPFMYLGLPISDRKLTVEQWLFLVRKLGNKIEPWLSRLLSSGGRLTLTNACLDNLPMFAMGLFLLQDGHHKDYLDACLEGSFTSKEVEARWDLLERIQSNTEDWENDKGYVEKPPFKPLPPKEGNGEKEKKKKGTKKRKKRGIKRKSRARGRNREGSTFGGIGDTIAVGALARRNFPIVPEDECWIPAKTNPVKLSIIPIGGIHLFIGETVDSDRNALPEDAGEAEESILGNLSPISDDASTMDTEEYNRLTKELEDEEAAAAESAPPKQVLATLASLDHQEEEDENSQSDPQPSHTVSPLSWERPHPEALEAKSQEMLAIAKKFATTAAAMLDERKEAAHYVDNFLKREREVDESLVKVKQLQKHWEDKVTELQQEAEKIRREAIPPRKITFATPTEQQPFATPKDNMKKDEEILKKKDEEIDIDYVRTLVASAMKQQSKADTSRRLESNPDHCMSTAQKDAHNNRNADDESRTGSSERRRKTREHPNPIPIPSKTPPSDSKKGKDAMYAGRDKYRNPSPPPTGTRVLHSPAVVQPETLGLMGLVESISATTCRLRETGTRSRRNPTEAGTTIVSLSPEGAGTMIVNLSPGGVGTKNASRSPAEAGTTEATITKVKVATEAGARERRRESEAEAKNLTAPL